MSKTIPSLNSFERHVARRDHDASAAEAVRILNHIEQSLGLVAGIEGAPGGPGKLERFATRFVSTFAQMICDPAFALSLALFERLIYYHRWLVQLFFISGFGSSAHLMPLIAETTDNGAPLLSFKGDRLRKFLLLYDPDTGLKFDVAQCMSNDAAASAAAFLSYIGTRYCYTESAYALREALLEWLPGKFDHVQFGSITLSKCAAPYMQCSYATTPGKHRIKADIVGQLRRLCLDAGCTEMVTPPRRGGKPVIVVVTDNFSEHHSVFRTHSHSIKALREGFHVVGAAYQRNLHPAVKDCFDEIIVIPNEDYLTDIKSVCEAIRAREPDIVFHLGVGMSAHTIALAALRLAPVQCASFGHTATTMSPAIDYMILPEDFVKSPTCYSERLLLVKPEAMPYAARADADDIIDRLRSAKVARDSVVRIAVLGSTMKLNPRVFDALVRIEKTAKAKTEIHFFALAAIGIAHLSLQRRVREVLPHAIVHEQSDHGPYLERLAGCDLFLCPFPYGNMNSIIDAAQLGMPGVCLDGEEAHAHADAAYFRRIGLPDELIADSVENYVAAAVRLIDDSAWLDHCRALALAGDLDKAFYAGDGHLFREAMLSLLSAPTAS